MKRLIVTLAIAVSLVSASLAADWREKAVETIKSEPKVVDALFTQDISLWVSMRDDGSRRDGFAEYLCMTLHEEGMNVGDFVIIKILDAAALAQQNTKEIGRFECEKK